MIISLTLLISCQDKELKDAGLSEPRIMKDAEGRYFRIRPNVGDTFFIDIIDEEELTKF